MTGHRSVTDHRPSLDFALGSEACPPEDRQVAKARESAAGWAAFPDAGGSVGAGLSAERCDGLAVMIKIEPPHGDVVLLGPGDLDIDAVAGGSETHSSSERMSRLLFARRTASLSTRPYRK